MLKIPVRLVITALVLALIISTISVGGCPKKSKNSKAGSSNNSFTINAPLSLTATVISYSQINLAWIDNALNNDGFEIQRSIGNMRDYVQLSTVDDNITSFTDTNLNPFSVYYYRVRAFNYIGDASNWSNDAVVFIVMSWSALAVGESHNLAITTDKTIWTWGLNETGQLGLGIEAPTSITFPTQMGSNRDWSSVGAGYYHTLAIKTNLTLWVWGANESGQLGLGDTDQDRYSPVQVGTESVWIMVIGGSNHSIALKTNNTLLSWGGNWDGQLGLGDSNYLDRYSPAQVGTASDWSIASSAGLHNIALKTNYSIWAWGYNGYNQLGLGDTINRNTPTMIGTSSDWLKIAAGSYHTIALKSNGTIWAWGMNNTGQLGVCDYVDRITPTQITTETDWSMIAAGGTSYSDYQEQIYFLGHNIAIKIDGTMWSWGANDYGQLGLGTYSTATSPIQIDTISGCQKALAGGYHSIAQTNSGALWVWGRNDYNQLGLVDTLTRDIPYALGSPSQPNLLFADIINTSQIVLSWIDLSYNESGFRIERKTSRSGTYELLVTVNSNITYYVDANVLNNNTYYYRVQAYNDSGGSPYSNEAWMSLSSSWSKVILGNNHTLAIKNNPAGGRTLWSWGSNTYGGLGLGDLINRNIPSSVGSETDWSELAAGSAHTIALKINPAGGGTLWSWGWNYIGQLGLGHTDDRSTPTQIDTASDWSFIAAGITHSAAIKTNNTLWVWGYNDSGRLGVGDTRSRNTPSQVGTNSDWQQITCGSSHNVALMTNKTLRLWGYNYQGQLGLGYTSPSEITPTQIGTDSDWSEIFAGVYHTITKKTNGTIWSWGINNSGQIGLGYTNNYVFTPSQIGADSDWIIITAGSNYTIGQKTNGIIWCWGGNEAGQLGLGDVMNRTSLTQFSSITDWYPITGKGSYSMGLKTNGTIWAWGSNNSGQLGLGDISNRNTPTIIGE